MTSTGTNSASAAITLSFTLTSSVSLSVETVPVGGAEACEGGSAQATMTATQAGGVVDFGSGIVPGLPSTVTNGCALRASAEGEDGDGMHLVAALKSTLMVSGHPGATLTLARSGGGAGGFETGTIPSDALRFLPGNPSVAEWRAARAGVAVPDASAGAVLLEGGTSGSSAVNQVAVFVPDSAPPGRFEADLILSVTPE